MSLPEHVKALAEANVKILTCLELCCEKAMEAGVCHMTVQILAAACKMMSTARNGSRSREDITGYETQSDHRWNRLNHLVAKIGLKIG